jgi:hypothetical protein
MVKKFTILLYAPAATTLIAGILHLNKVIDTISSGEAISNADILFLVGGIAQVFWIVPIIRQWGKTWYSIGIAGTAVFVILWVITRIPESNNRKSWSNTYRSNNNTDISNRFYCP